MPHVSARSKTLLINSLCWKGASTSVRITASPSDSSGEFHIGIVEAGTDEVGILPRLFRRDSFTLTPEYVLPIFSAISKSDRPFALSWIAFSISLFDQLLPANLAPFHHKARGYPRVPFPRDQRVNYRPSWRPCAVDPHRSPVLP